MKTIIEMAREAGFNKNELAYLGDNFARFAELVIEQANVRANASWTSMCNKMVGFEREACAKVCEAEAAIQQESAKFCKVIIDQRDFSICAAAIRARGNTCQK